MNRFPKPLVLIDLGDTYQVNDPFVYESKLAGEITVPRGFPTDLASARVAWFALRGKVDHAAVIHDWLYANGACSRVQADAIFREAMRAKNCGHWFTWTVWLAVRIGARKPWQNHRKGNTAGARFVRLQKGSDMSSLFNRP